MECLAPLPVTKPAEVVQEACQVLQQHGYPIEELQSELYYSSMHTLCSVLTVTLSNCGVYTV